MKMRKCPYCGRRISYTSSFASRRKAEYICQKCGKESKVAVDKKVILFFIVAVVISLAIMAGWILAGLVSNPLGILLVAIPLIIFTAASPSFVHYEPYKKYRKSMEAKKAGIAYSDNLLTSELDEDENYTFPSITPQQNDTMIILKLTRMYLTKSEPKEMPQDKDLIQMRFLPIHRLLKSRTMFP